MMRCAKPECHKPFKVDPPGTDKVAEEVVFIEKTYPNETTTTYVYHKACAPADGKVPVDD